MNEMLAGETLAGQLVRLRVATEEDFPTLARWWEDPALAALQHSTFRPQPQETAIGNFRLWSANRTPEAVGFAIEAGGELAGHLTLYGLTLPTRIATYAIMLGPDFQGRGYGVDATKLALRYAFEELGAHKVELTTQKYNARAQATYRKAGFIVEGIRRAASFHRGTWHDEVLMGVVLEDWLGQYRSTHAE